MFCYVFAIIRPIDIAHFSFLIGNVFGQIVETPKTRLSFDKLPGTTPGTGRAGKPLPQKYFNVGESYPCHLFSLISDFRLLTSNLRLAVSPCPRVASFLPHAHPIPSGMA